MDAITKAHTRRAWLEVLAFAVVFVAVWLPRALALDQFVALDENNWIPRSAKFYSALEQGRFADTFQREHPGVTTMWAGSAGILWNYFSPKGPEASPLTFDEYNLLIRQHKYSVLEVLSSGRFFMVLSSTLALVLAFVFARRLIGFLPALVGFLLIAFDPFHAAHSRLLHLDGLLASLLLLALLSFLSFLQNRRASDLILSGVAGGLSWLTKSPSAFLIPATILLSGFDAWSRRSLRGGTRFYTILWEALWPLAVWGLVALVVFIAFWPAMWVDPIGTLSKVTGQALGYASGGHATPVFFNGTIYPDGKIDDLSFYPISYLWRSTPIVLLGLLMAAVGFIWRLGPFAKAETRRAISGLVLFVIVFALLHSLGAKKFDRYLLPVYAPLDLVAATGWVSIVTWLGTRRSGPVRRYGAWALLTIAVLVQAMAIGWTFPYYLSYYNPLMGGSKRAPETMMIGWGEGLDEAARYLNERPLAADLRVTAWYGDSFSPFFVGSTRSLPFLSELTEAQVQQALDTDFAVIYIHQWQRQMPRQLLEALAEQTPVHSVWIDGLEYARIYKLINVPPPPEPSQLIAEGNLGGVARLVGYDPPPPLQAPMGSALPLTLTWECLGTTESEYTVFLHLVGDDKRPVTQVDSQPLGGRYPTTAWDVGERLVDPYQLAIPPDLPPGEYELLAGMYLLSTGNRLPLLDQEGKAVGDSISLGQVDITER